MLRRIRIWWIRGKLVARLGDLEKLKLQAFAIRSQIEYLNHKLRQLGADNQTGDGK